MTDIPDTGGTATLKAFDRLLARLRRRRRLRQVLRGVLVALLGVSLCALLAALWMGASHFAQDSVAAARIAVYVGAAGLLAVCVLWPLLRRLDDEQCALRTERHAPQLDGLLLSALAVRRLETDSAAARNTSPELAAEVVRRAVHAAESEYRLTENDDRESLRASLATLVLTVVLAFAVGIAPLWLQHGLRLLAMPLDDPASGNPFYFDVAPGDTLRSAGDDQLIIASARGFSPPAVTLYHRPVGEAQWQALSMQGDRADFTVYLRAITQPLEYRVRAGGIESPSYRIDVTVPPVLERIDVTYHYPDYTGRAPQTVQDAGDIRAPRGTRVAMQLYVANAPDGGRLVLDGDKHRTLHKRTEDVYQIGMTLQDSGRYRVELMNEQGEPMAVSPEFAIHTLEDALPRVAVRSPGRDARVSSLEEVDVSVEASDDFGVRELELVLSVNGGDEEVVTLTGADQNPELLEAVETLYLEERKLSPGDLIAYYARARDATDAASRPDVVTDIFFMEVRPFEREFRNANQSGGGGGGSGQQQEQLAAQQRMLVVALYNTVRDRGKLSDPEHRAKLDKIGDAQGRIRARVEAIVRRLQARDILQLDPGYRQMAVELPKAATAMRDVESELQTGEGRSAQTPARTALLHLQRAEAAFRSVRIARSDARGNDAGDLRNLFRLEMDRFRNQYADVRRGQWQADEENIDKTLEQLRELARRQQREVERARLRGERGEGDAARSQQALAEEAERMARELQRLSLQNPELRELAERLRRAAASMREAAAGNGAANSREALRQLREARDRLRDSGPQRLAGEIERAARDVRELQREQEAVTEGLERGEGEADTRRAVSERKRGMQERLAGLREQLKRLSQQARGREQVRRDLTGAARTLDENVAGNLEHTQRLLQESLPTDKTAENAIGEGLGRARERLESAAAGVAGGEQERVARAREQLRDVVRGIAGMGTRTEGGFGGGDTDRPGTRLRGEAVNLRDALRAHAGVLRDLRGGLVSRPKAVGDIDQVIEGLNALADELSNGGEGTRRYAELLQALQDIDYALREDNKASDRAQEGFAPRQVQPAPEHRPVVEAYYRELSESARAAQ